MAAVDATSGYDRMKEVKEFDESKIGVKGLSDSGITSIPRIFIHPPETLSDLKSSSTCTKIPVIDLSNLNSANHRPKIVEQIREAASTWGFFQVINHGIPVSILDETTSPIKAFHEQPTEVRAKHYVREEGHGVIYSSNHDLYKAKAASWHDSLQVSTGPEPPKVEQVPEICRREVVAWDMHATKVAETVEELLSEGLGLEAGKFKELTFSDSKLIADTCYPYCPQPDLTVGITSHTDAAINGDGFVAEPSAGVASEARGGVGGGLIINIGDFLRIISNGKYQSVEHRVLANSSKEPRVSIVMFFSLSEWKGSGYYGPLPELLSPEKPAIYRDFTMQEFKENVYSKGFDSKSFINKIKI